MRAVLLALLALPLFGADDALLTRAFDHFYNLEYDQALTGFTQSLAQNPKDPDRYNHVAQTILYRAMFHAGALESEMVSGTNPFLRRDKVNPSAADQQRFDDAVAAALTLCQETLKTNPNDTASLYALGVAYGLRANYNFLVRKAWMDSLRDATQARKAHNRVTELDPSQVDARLVQGLHDYIIGSLPWTYKILGFLAGFHGDRDTGIQTLLYVGEKGVRNKYDSLIFLATIYRREHRAAEAIPIAEKLLQLFPRNYLISFELAQLYADCGNKDAALATLRRVEELKRSGAAAYQALPVEKIYYQLGNLQFWYREFPEAAENLRKAAARSAELDLNTGVLSWLRLGQTCDMLGRRREAEAAYRKAIELAPQSELAREARRYLSTPYRRS